MKLVSVDILIHRNGKDILQGSFIMGREIEGIILLQFIALLRQFIAIEDAGFPGIQLLAPVCPAVPPLSSEAPSAVCTMK